MFRLIWRSALVGVLRHDQFFAMRANRFTQLISNGPALELTLGLFSGLTAVFGGIAGSRSREAKDHFQNMRLYPATSAWADFRWPAIPKNPIYAARFAALTMVGMNLFRR